jgi:hypothetical protein
MAKKGNDLDRPKHRISTAHRVTGIRSVQTLNKLEDRLSKPVYRNKNGCRYYSTRQNLELRELWSALNPDRVPSLNEGLENATQIS